MKVWHDEAWEGEVRLRDREVTLRREEIPEEVRDDLRDLLQGSLPEELDLRGRVEEAPWGQEAVLGLAYRGLDLGEYSAEDFPQAGRVLEWLMALRPEEVP